MQARTATEAIELALVQREDDFDREELDLGRRVAHLASFRYVPSCASISRSAAESARSTKGAFFTGRMMSASPSVLISRGVSFVMFGNSGIGRSMMSPRLLPTDAVSAAALQATQGRIQLDGERVADAAHAACGLRP